MARRLSAFVIGNAAYVHGEKLLNPVNDVGDISARLTNLGFSVIKLVDATTEQMDQGLEAFGTTLATSDVGLFFFAGHGFQIDGINFLAGVDTKSSAKLAVQYSALQLDKVIRTMKMAQAPTSIIILDACRNNPFDPVLYRSGGSPGLAPVYAPKGTLIAFSTSPGEKSIDGTGRNGAYTSALLQHLDTPDLSIETMFKRVRNTLDTTTGGRQTSWEHTSLAGEFRFRLSLEASIEEYGRTALADSLFVLNNTQPDHQLIKALKSYTWPVQNPAVKAFGPNEANLFTRDALFVIGRNLYQAACGSSNEAAKYIADFMGRTQGLDEFKRKSLLDGMVFEIFFDSEGQRRVRPKISQLNQVFKLQRYTELSSSFAFLAACLGPYAENYYSLPGSNASVSIDIVAEAFLDENEYHLTAVQFESVNILQDTRTGDKEEGYVFERRFDTEEFADFLSEQMVVPKDSLTIVYPFAKTNRTKLIVPSYLTVRKGGDV
jgi:Caspase domain